MTLQYTFTTYGIPDKLSYDGGPNASSYPSQTICQCMGNTQPPASVSFPHSDCRTEVGVKTIKFLITSIVGKDGAINIDVFQAEIWKQPRSYHKNVPSHVYIIIWKSSKGHPASEIQPTYNMERVPMYMRSCIKTPPYASPREME